MSVQPQADEASPDVTEQADEPQSSSAANDLVSYTRGYVARLKGGDLGSIPALGGLIVISIFFAIVHQGFLSAYNVEALVVQSGPIIIMAMGLVFVLLLGEIDLSAGTTGGMSAAIMAVLLARHHQSWWVAVLAGLAAGLIIGYVMGWLRSKVGIPSFVITLATFLGFQGVTLILIGGDGSINVSSKTILTLEGLNGKFLPSWAGWLLLAVVVVGYAIVKMRDSIGRRAAGLPSMPPVVVLAKVVLLAALGAGFIYMMGINRILTQNAFFDVKSEGTPYVVLLIVILFIVWNFVLNRTRYGRHIYAVGGSDEASRRAGINVSKIRISVFVICSGMAALSGIAAASQLESVQSNAGAQNTLLLAVGAAVIGGTSLFGGRGRMIDAVLGGLVVEVIQNGMSDLIQGSDSAGWEWIVTGGVLLLAAGFDAVARKRARGTS